MFDTDLTLVPVASVVFLISLYFTVRLFRETGREKYWFFLMVAAFSFSFHEWIKIPKVLGLLEGNIIFFVTSLGDLIGGISLAYAAFGLYRSMKEIRMKLSKKLEEK